MSLCYCVFKSSALVFYRKLAAISFLNMELPALYGSCAQPEGNFGNPVAIKPIGKVLFKCALSVCQKKTHLSAVHSLQTSGSPQLRTVSAAGNDQTSV